MTGYIGYDYTLLHNRLLGLCRRLADEAGKDDSRDRGVAALGAIVLADVAAEAAINHLVEVTFPPVDLRKRPEPQAWLHRMAHAHVTQFRPPRQRLKALAELFGLSLSWEADEPWRSLGDLHELRNALVHYPSTPVKSTSPSTETFPRRRHLEPIARRLGTFSKFEAGGTWLDVFLNEQCARWACDTANAVLKALDSPPWKGRALR